MSVFQVNISDKDEEDDQEKDEEGNDEETIHFDTIEYEEYKEQEVIEEVTQEDEETNLVKIVAIVIVSLPHRLRKLLTTSSAETTQARFIVTTNDNTNVQSLFAPF